MATDLSTFLDREMTEGEFTPYVEFSPEADALTFYFRPDADYSERLTDHITLFRSIDDNSQLVGCRVKGVRDVIDEAGNYIDVDHDGIKLSIIFLSVQGKMPKEEMREVVRELGRAAKDSNLELTPA